MATEEFTIKMPTVPLKNRAERKAALQQSAEKSLEAIQNQLGDLKNVGKTALIIGGTIVAAYALTEILLPSPKTVREESFSQKNDENEGETILWAAIKGIATSVLLALAKDKLMELIENLTEKDAKPSAE